MPIDLNRLPILHNQYVDDMRDRDRRIEGDVRVCQSIGHRDGDDDYITIDRGMPMAYYEGALIIIDMLFPKVITHPRTFMDLLRNVNQNLIEPYGNPNIRRQKIMGIEIEVNPAVPEGHFLMYNRNHVAETMLEWRRVGNNSRGTEKWLERWRK